MPILVRAVKTQQSQNDALNAETLALKKQMTALAAALRKLQDSAAESRK